jgi:hypothetical protein
MLKIVFSKPAGAPAGLGKTTCLSVGSGVALVGNIGGRERVVHNPRVGYKAIL